MKTYVRPTIEVVALRAEEYIANPNSGGLPRRNNGFGNGDQEAPGRSLENNGAENDQGKKGNKK